MKHIGIIGGLTPESTIEYYKIICREYNKKAGGLNFPKITIRSVNLQEVFDLFSAGKWDDMADVVVSEISDLKKAGADFAAMATNTPHNAYERIKEYSQLKVLSIMDATAQEIKRDGIKKIGLLGTKQTMEFGIFQKTFADYGIEAITPEKEDRDYVNQVIWNELAHGIISDKSREGYKKIMDKLVQRGAKGIILGCTEIPLLIKQSDSPVKTYDTTRIHAEAILDYAMKGREAKFKSEHFSEKKLIPFNFAKRNISFINHSLFSFTRGKKEMKPKELLKTLNPKQKAYVNLNLKDPKNGEYLLTVFHFIPSGDLNTLQAATEIAAESSTGTNFKVQTETPFSREMNALVYKLDLEKNLVWIAYPWRLFDRGGNVQNILTYIVGNVLGMKQITALKLLDCWFSPSMLEQYDGPGYTLDDMRKYLNVYGRPILGTIIKPKMGLTSSEYAEVCYDFWVGGGDFVKNDEPQANQDFCPYDKMVKYVKKAMDKAVRQTGKKKVHSFNVSASDFDTMIERCEMIINEGFEPGSYAFLIDGITAGWMALQTLRRKYPGVFIHFHRAAHGAFTRPENPIGFSVLVLSKFARLAGASGIHTGTAGVGKMKGNPKEDVTAAKNILHFKDKGHFFSQSWSRIPEKDEDAIRLVHEDLAHHLILEDDEWRGMKKCCPIISGGLNPTSLKPFIDIMGNVDFITTMGAGCHAHPGGTKKGATALVQSCEAYLKKIDISEYAKTHKELADAISFFSKKKAEVVQAEESEKS